MSEKGLNNRIYLMHTCTQLYIKRTGISMADFLDLDKRYKILKYIKNCSWEFDGLPDDDMFHLLEEYINGKES